MAKRNNYTLHGLQTNRDDSIIFQNDGIIIKYDYIKKFIDLFGCNLYETRPARIIKTISSFFTCLDKQRFLVPTNVA